MKNQTKTPKQTAVRGRSSALIATIVIHAVFLLLAGTYVAMEVIERQEAKFEAKQIARPKMKLKKLQVPVNFQKQMKQAAPKMSARMTATPKLDMKSVDFKMPDTAGLGSGLGGGGGLGGSLGFASTQIDLFGLKSNGEKIVFLLDAGDRMLADEIGGIPAYKIIKKELVNIVDAMPPTALFNVLVFTHNECRALSPDMLPATDENMQRFKKWIMPLNAQKQKYGLQTLGFAGTPIQFEPFPTIFNSQDNWVAGLGYATRKGADLVYWLGDNEYMDDIYKEYYQNCKRGDPLPYNTGWPPELPRSKVDYEPCGGIEGWRETVARASQLHEQENKERLARGLPVRVNPAMRAKNAWLVKTYIPDALLPETTRPREGKEHDYTAKDLEEYIESVSQKYNESKMTLSLGLTRKTFTFNAIHFVKRPQMNNEKASLKKLSELADKLDGKYVKIEGGAAIQ